MCGGLKIQRPSTELTSESIWMTSNTSKTKANHKYEAQTIQQHHQQAGQHSQYASASHLAAMKLHGSGDHKAANKHAKNARDHTTQASQQVAQVDNVSGPGSSDHNTQAK
jgi:hypothetical protein